MDFFISHYEVLYLQFANALGSYGFSAIALAIIIHFLMIKPVSWAAKISAEELQFQSVIAPQLKQIQKQSSGREQHKRITQLHSRYSYHPMYAVRQVLPLLIQLPLLILTYFMFEGTSELNGHSFYFIQDLGQADNLLYGNGNFLPFVMLSLNLLAAFFMPGFNQKEFLRGALVSFLFFVLLYQSKSILLLYWATTNALLLARNIMYYIVLPDSKRGDLKQRIDTCMCYLSDKKTVLFFVIFLFYVLVFSVLLQHGYSHKLSVVLVKLLIAMLFMIVGLRFFYRVKNERPFPSSLDQSTNGGRYKDILLVLLPMTPIVQYVLLNHDILTFTQQLAIIGIFAVGTFASLIIYPLIFEKWLAKVWLVALGIALLGVYFYMPVLSAFGRWTVAPDVSLLVALIVMAMSVVGYLYLHKRTALTLFSVAFFIVNTLNVSYNVFVQDGFKSPIAAIKTVNLSNFIAGNSMQQKPDIYLLTYDAYVGQNVMDQYGIDNRAQEAFLIEQGFKIYPNVYSTGPNSLTSMSRVLEMNSTLSKSERHVVAGNAMVPQLLKKNGYSTHAVLTPYFLANAASVINYDQVFPHFKQNDALGMVSVIRGIRDGVFRFDTITESGDYSHDEFVSAKRRVFEQQSVQPKFMYTHTGPHHTQNPGRCAPNETQLFEERLSEANEEMKGDIASIIDSHRDAIIVINSDHGPYITGDCAWMENLNSYDELSRLNIQDRFGAFLAVKWPSQKFEKYDDDITVVQQIFEVVFKYLHQEDIVLSHSMSLETLKLNQTPGIVKDGVIQIGKHKGEPLYLEIKTTD